MTSLKGLLLLAAQLLAAAASPVDSPQAMPAPNLAELSQTNRVNQIEAGYLPPGPVALSAALAKYGKEVPTQILLAASSASATQTAQVTATNLPFDKAYLVNVTVGGSTLLLDFDTGSSDLWVFSTAQPKAQRKGHHLYRLGGTKVANETWKIRYGDGSGAAGVVYADKVRIGGVTVPTQAVEAATSVSNSFVRGENDGLVGLGFDEGNTCRPYQCYTFMHNAAPLMPRPLFTATLRRGAPGEYDFGFIDPSKYTGALTTVTLTDASGAGYWEFTSGGYSINGSAQVAHSMDAIADTGTSLVIVDDAVVNAYYAPVAGAHYNATWGGFIFPCSSALPSLGFGMGGAVHTMPGSYGIYAPLAQPTGYCYGGVQSNAGSGLNILGDVWLKSQFVVFNYNQGGSTGNIAFAQQAGVAT